MTIIEPGGARTGFRSTAGAQMGATPDGYDNTPVAMIRAVLEDPKRVPIGDPARMVRIMIDSVDQEPVPKRIVLGTDSYTMIEKALTERLASVRAQKEFASSTDFPADN